ELDDDAWNPVAPVTRRARVNFLRAALGWLPVAVVEQDALQADRRLYQMLAAVHGNAAHSQYNALIRLLVSFERALELRLSRSRRAAA
ncbi:MAG: hypothetical protein N2689_06250, partial [Verrucomicrobiae bacterium]|nr:hypothetical protein [Verrucomicrobiae bacterium]